MRLRLAISSLIGSVALAVSSVTAAAVTVVPDGGFVVQGSTAEVERQIDVVHDAGARWISLSVAWSQLEPQKGVYPAPAWDDLGVRLAYARSRSMHVELRLFDAPAWASGRSGGDDPPTPGHLADYGAFLTGLAGRFGGLIDVYSPWNEPNRAAFWNPVDPDAFTALQKVAYPAIKAADPTSTVLYGPVVGRYAQQNSGYTFLRRSYELGAKGSFDAIGWNGYPGGAPESSAPVEGGIPAANTLPAQLYLRNLIDAVDPGRKVWIMEFGWSTCANCDVSSANGASEATQADYLSRAFEYRRQYLADYVERMFWYPVRDTGTNRSAWDQNEGVLRNDWSAKPALAAFRALGVEDADGVLPAPGTGGATPTPPALPSSAARLGLPAAARSARGATSIGRTTLTRRNGFFTLTVRVGVRGGRTVVALEGFRGGHWRRLTAVRVARRSVLKFRVRDRGWVGFRIRATVPGRTGFRVGRVVRVPPLPPGR